MRRRSPVAGAVRAGERVYLSGAQRRSRPDGAVAGLGDAAAQTHAALDRLEAALARRRRLARSTSRSSRPASSTAAIGPTSTAPSPSGCRACIRSRPGSSSPGSARPELIVQIDAEAAIPARRAAQMRPYTFENWHGQGFPWQGAMVVATDDEFFVRGQTGSAARPFRHRRRRAARSPMPGSRPISRLRNLATLLEEAGGSLEDVCKITVYISDRAYRAAVYPMIGKHFGEVRPVSTGIVTTAFARPDILFEIDVVAIREAGRRAARAAAAVPFRAAPATARRRSRSTASSAWRWSPGDRVILRGQTGMGLDEKLYGARRRRRRRPSRRWTMSRRCSPRPAPGSPTSPRRPSTSPSATIWPAVNAAVLKRLRRHRAGLHDARREGAREPRPPDGGRRHGDPAGTRPDDLLARRSLRPHGHARRRRHHLLARGRLALPLRGGGRRRRPDAAHDRSAARPARRSTSCGAASAPRHVDRALAAATPRPRLAPARPDRPARAGPPPIRGASYKPERGEAHGRDCVAIANIVRSRGRAGRHGARLRGRSRRAARDASDRGARRPATRPAASSSRSSRPPLAGRAREAFPYRRPAGRRRSRSDRRAGTALA